MSDFCFYGARRIAGHLQISESTLRRWRKTAEGKFIQVGSMSNAGGGQGRAAWSYASSLDNLKLLMQARMSEVRGSAAQFRWHTLRSPTDVSSGSVFEATSVGAVRRSRSEPSGS